jgi:deoxyribose-phosphate aldolase
VNVSRADLERLIEEITDDLYERLSHPVRAKRDEVCSDCTGTCAQRCAFKMGDFLSAGAGRFTAGLGIGKTAPEVASLIDHTLLKPDATEREVSQLCAEAAEHSFASVCVNPVWVSTCARKLAGTKVKVCTVAGFPLGATLSEIKRAEADRAQDLGATEIDMVMAIGLLKSGRLDDVERDIAAVTSVCRKDVIVKVILETCLLNDDEKRAACRIAVRAGAHYVKTSTGFSSGGATVADIELMRAEVGPGVGVKASGGVRDRATLDQLVAAGATRIGASAGVKIVKGG